MAAPICASAPGRSGISEKIIVTDAISLEEFDKDRDIISRLNRIAMNDCLCDLNLPENSGGALVFYCYYVFESIMSEIAWNILDIIEIQLRRYLLLWKRLLALVQSNIPQIKRAAVKPLF